MSPCFDTKVQRTEGDSCGFFFVVEKWSELPFQYLSLQNFPAELAPRPPRATRPLGEQVTNSHHCFGNPFRPDPATPLWTETILWSETCVCGVSWTYISKVVAQAEQASLEFVAVQGPRLILKQREQRPLEKKYMLQKTSQPKIESFFFSAHDVLLYCKRINFRREFNFIASV